MIDTGYYTSEALTLLHSLIGIPSISREEEAAADFLQNYIEETGIMTGRSGNNIWCSPTRLLSIPEIYQIWMSRTEPTACMDFRPCFIPW